jgi:hypothetical protein
VLLYYQFIHLSTKIYIKYVDIMNRIYADSDVCRWHLTQLNLEITDEITASSSAVFHMPYPYDPEFEIKIERAVAVCPKVVILVSELHAESTRFIVNHQHPRIKYFVCGFVEGYSSNQWMDWFITTSGFYKHNDLLDHLFPYRVKPKVFDVLLGWAKPHRQKIYDYLLENKLTHRVTLTYLRDRSLSLQQQLPDSWIWPDIDIPKDTLSNTITRVKYKNNQVSLSQIISTDIYNQSSYTIVAETNYDNHYSFYTEKIVKPILAQRLFIVFSGQHYLSNLRQLGFKTFNGIIDETYDSIEDSEQRFSMALKQMRDLIDQPQEEILAKIRPITEHNKRVMIETDWYADFARELRAVLLDHTRQN